MVQNKNYCFAFQKMVKYVHQMSFVAKIHEAIFFFSDEEFWQSSLFFSLFSNQAKKGWNKSREQQDIFISVLT